MRELTVHVNDRKEKMLLRSLKSTKDVVDALRMRGTLHSCDSQIDVDDYFNEGFLYLSDVITGQFIVSVTW